MHKGLKLTGYTETIILVIIVLLTAVSFLMFTGINTYKTTEWLMSFILIFLVIVNLVGVALLNRIYERLGTKRR